MSAKACMYTIRYYREILIEREGLFSRLSVAMAQ